MLSFLVAFLDVALESTRVKWLQQLKTAQKLGRDRHDCSPVVELSAILQMISKNSCGGALYPYIWSTENSDEDSIIEKFVSVFDHHVRSANQIKVVCSEKLRDDPLPEAVADTSFIRLPVMFHIGGI